MAIGENDRTGHETTREARKEQSPPTEPILTHRHNVRGDGASSKSPVCNLSSDARDIVGLEVDGTAVIEIYRDRLVIFPGGEDES